MPDIDSDSCLNIDKALWKELYPFRFKCQRVLAEAGAHSHSMYTPHL